MTTETDMNDDYRECYVGATDAVGERRLPVRVMIRVENDFASSEAYGLGDGQMAGWVFMCGREDDSEVNLYRLTNVIDVNSPVIRHLNTPAPCRFDWDDVTREFIRTE